ncbi:hypothetical protein AMTRI_Chr09g32070 [Amborella trichopoda]|uniref:uncharacterized protein LOC18437535 n=1 Tax=Amborella trichopoda TaxID=13333 RepID=UPI0005D3B746|nr:uncharacterized protein LOC18437535 [Amborella trichopoda]XP_020524969.1 uncharacterized protein LOC18437535 [Amborella trichopoda]|eukprot:XP_011624781.1 uncharacterized protein LOC18437535 [Amborella trichopoda]
MGNVLNGIGVGVGSAVLKPLDIALGTSCELTCQGTWDIICFIRHFCISSLVKMALVILLIYFLFQFLILLCRLGVFGFLARSLGKMARAFCGTYFFAIRDICGFLWYKLKNTKRINRRRRFQDHDECSECESSSDTWLDAGKRAKKKRRSFGPERHPKRARHQAKRGNRKHRTRDVKS